MKYAIGLGLLGVIGAMLAYVGLWFTDWEYWVLVLSSAVLFALGQD